LGKTKLTLAMTPFKFGSSGTSSFNFV